VTPVFIQLRTTAGEKHWLRFRSVPRADHCEQAGAKERRSQQRQNEKTVREPIRDDHSGSTEQYRETETERGSQCPGKDGEEVQSFFFDVECQEIQPRTHGRRERRRQSGY
jgi:hypothetical protein